MATRPNLEQLKKQAREFLNALVQGDADAHKRLRAVHPKHSGSASDTNERLVLTDAQLVLAREHEFPSWPRLKRFVDDLDKVDREAEALRQAWSQGDESIREEVRKAKEPYFRSDRFEKPNPDDELTSHDAHAVVAMGHGYARWDKYESFLHLDPNVRDVIAAIKVGDLERVREILAEDPAAARAPLGRRVSGHTPDPGTRREQKRIRARYGCQGGQRLGTAFYRLRVVFQRRQHARE